MILFNNLSYFLPRSYGLGETKWVLHVIFRFSKGLFQTSHSKNIASQMELNFRKLREVSFITCQSTKTSFIFYTSITGWENLKYIHRVFFQKFTVLLSESSVSKSNPEELELNQRKIRHGFCWEHVRVQKTLSFFSQLSPSGICRRGFKPIFLVVAFYFLSYVNRGVQATSGIC